MKIKLHAAEAIASGPRISSIDICRAIAILAVVIYHFKLILPFGYLGVDLFFVISGFLVGGILIKQVKQGNKINLPRFLLLRGFKIWPSYFWFLLAGNVIAAGVFRHDNPFYIISGIRDYSRFIFFYYNYTGPPFPSHPSFDHIWSLCIEEHFYILLPLSLVIMPFILKNNLTMLITVAGGMILTGIVFKFFSFYYTPGIPTYTTTHNRLDALGWGVLLSILVTYFGEHLKKIKWLPWLLVVGLLLMIGAIIAVGRSQSRFFESTVFYSLVPFCFFLMVLGIYFFDFHKWKFLRIIAYYSYNWYLWHPLILLVVLKYVKSDLIALPVFMLASFGIAVLFTILIEERFLRIRGRLFQKLYPVA